MSYDQITKKMKEDSYKLASLSGNIRDGALAQIAKMLRQRKEEIFEANSLDLKNAEFNCIAAPIINRLKFDEHKLNDVLSGIRSLIGLSDPLFQNIFTRYLDDGLILKKVTCPIGVIGVIFESRPDALVQISTLCIKSGNCAILKGGSEAANTNRVLFEIIKDGGLMAGLPMGFATLIENRAGIDELLKCDHSVDLIIPRGSNQFVQYIMENSKIPVMGHADGVCHIYVDEYADINKAIPIIIDAKTQYVAACNAVETLLVHKNIAARILPKLQEQSAGKIRLKGCSVTKRVIDCELCDESDYNTEYLDYILSIKVVENMDEAIEHINRYGSHHTDCIVTEDTTQAEKFMTYVDSAGVYQNCSTRFADGYRYGFGAEVGISTGKLHARGPVGLDGLVTYKYKLYGHGHIVDDYATGRKEFHFKDC